MPRYLSFVVLGFFLFDPWPEIPAFSSTGPETHFSITRDSLKQFARDRDIAVDPLCGDMLRQFAVISDSEDNAEDFTLHCDNDRITDCAYRLDELKHQSVHATNRFSSLRRMGMALHLIQDFYSHSNWVESAGFTMFLAPLEAFTWLPIPANIQTGFYPEYVSHPDVQKACFLFPVEQWGLRFEGATHGCMNKDSERQFRGITVVPGSPGITYHRLAAEYAKLHSVQFLHEMARANPWFKSCFLPPYFGGAECSGGILNK
ncbi:MAG: hypothetical protein KDK37_00795 [Leptospiraceae bacterium]|nr:hypothetical protein [Leptospiraceae bacterium]